MSDDLDDLLRTAMKTLDAQVPSGYFEGLPNRTLARLGDTMQTTGTSGSERDASSGVPPQAERDDDSGLHDIRSLASSTKARLSSRRSSTNPIVTDDDVLASSSAGWKAVALPEPAKMVSLPELAALPTKREVKEKDQAAKRAREAQDLEDKAVAKAAAASARSAKSTPVAAPAAEVPTSAPPIAMIGSRIAAKKKPTQSSGHGKTIALVGVGLAAAAGAVIFFQMNTSSEDKAPADGFKSKPLAPVPTMTAPMMDKTPAPPAVVAAPDPAPVVVPPAPEPAELKIASKGAEPKQKIHKVEIRDTMKGDAKPEVVKPVAPSKDDKKKDPDAGDPSFDALLKEAGVSDKKLEKKPKLDKTSLSGGDFKNGMGSISKKAQACFTGTQGTASVKLTVAPNGQVSKVSVTGVFTGTPTASCVESAVKGASFPPWDGGPQTFSYSFLLSD